MNSSKQPREESVKELSTFLIARHADSSAPIDEFIFKQHQSGSNKSLTSRLSPLVPIFRLQSIILKPTSWKDDYKRELGGYI